MPEALLAKTRDTNGTSNARRLRREGLVPGVIYMSGENTTSLTFNHKSLNYFLNHAHGLVDLQIEGEKKIRKCVVKDVNYDPVTEKIMHIDFLGVKMGEKITVTVPLTLTGVPEGEKFGGILEHVLREIDIECFPRHIPDFLEYDISELNVGDSVHVSDLSYENIDILNSPEDTVALVEIAKVVVVEETEEGEEGDGEEATDEAEETDGEDSSA